MRFLRKLLPLSLLVLLLLPLLLAACARQQPPLLETVRQRGTLIAGVKYDSKPFGYMDTDGQLKGYDIDLMRELAKRILGSESRVEFQQVLSSTRVIAVDSGNVDVVAATMTITPERERKIDFSRPYFTAHQAVMLPANSPAKKLDDLKGKTILFVMGTTSESNIKKRLPAAKYIGFKTSTDAMAALKAGRGNALTTDDTILYGFMAEHCGFRLLDEKLSDEPYGLAFRQSKAGETVALRETIDKHLMAMEQDGTLAALRAKWIKPALTPASACAK